ncbi:MAG TPA: RNA polymerase sigma factor [Burkholderiales bacterium]|nr:RNA polymerase sigma factor [Burkholderiales bacterium]
MTDTELVAKTLAGDMRALETLIRLHNGTLYRTARAILRDDAEAEDAVQDAFLQAFRALGSFRGESKLSTWLVRIAANEALMRLRRNANAAARTDVEADELVSREAGPERTVQSSELRQLLEARIGALPEDYRAVFMLRAIEELSVEETAAALGIPEATVRTRYFRARNLLRKALAGDADKRSSLDSPLLITQEDRARLVRLKPHAALLREIDRATVVAPKVAILADVVAMNTQVFYTDETSGTRQHLNLVYPEQAGGCVCCVSILAPVGTALIGLSAGQAIEWDFPDGAHRRLRVDQVVRHDCPINDAAQRGTVPSTQAVTSSSSAASARLNACTAPGAS